MDEPAYPRSIRRTLKLALTDTPVVALLGQRQSGKSTLVRALTPESEVSSPESPASRGSFMVFLNRRQIRV